MLWVSMPSACMVIDVYRRSLISVLNLKPPSFAVSTLLVVKPVCTFETPLPIGVVYVGAGCKLFPLRPSVWLNPCDFVSVSRSPLSVYYRIALLRPDLLNWLLPLSMASVLACDCLVAIVP